MGLLFRYISKKFWGPFFFALGVFAAMVVLGDTVEKLKTISNGYSTLGAVLTYSMFTFPNWLTTILPVACLLGAISVISEMVANGEWTACVASGFAPRQLFKPIIVCIIAAAAVSLAIQEFIVPPLNVKADIWYYTKIKPKDNYNLNVESDVAMRIGDSQMLLAKRVDLENGLMDEVSMDTYNEQWHISSQVVAKQLVWDKERQTWVFKQGTRRTFIDKLNTEDEQFDQTDAPITLHPKDMSVNSTEGKLLSIRDLNKRIRFFKQTGLSYYTAETERQAKLATPFVTLIMCLLGMPFAISLRRKSKILNIISSIVIAFTFWWLISMITSIGVNGYINPYVAGWGPVVFFGTLVFFEFKWLKL